jgi:hypothetical protein
MQVADSHDRVVSLPLPKDAKGSAQAPQGGWQTPLPTWERGWGKGSGWSGSKR